MAGPFGSWLRPKFGSARAPRTHVTTEPWGKVIPPAERLRPYVHTVYDQILDYWRPSKHDCKQLNGPKSFLTKDALGWGILGIHVISPCPWPAEPPAIAPVDSRFVQTTNHEESLRVWRRFKRPRSVPTMVSLCHWPGKKILPKGKIKVQNATKL